MQVNNRRSFLRLASCAGLALPLLNTPVHALGAGTHFSPPTHPMLYSRAITRFLSNDERIRVTREFEVRFSARDDATLGDVYEIEGEQLSVKVEAPESLNAFVQLEVSRVEQSSFPVTLSSSGQIVSSLAPPNLSQTIETARIEALEQITSQNHLDPEHNQLVALISSLDQANSSMVSQFPSELFAPGPTEQIETQTLSLPTGDEGHFTKRFGGLRDPDTGLMRSAERELTTQIGQSMRRTLEEWSLKEL